MKKLITILLVLVTIFNMAAFNVFAQDDIKVIVDGKEVVFDAAPYIENGRTMVPVRAIFEALGASVDWLPETRTVLAKKDAYVLTLAIGEDRMQKNSAYFALDAPASIKDDRTYVPVRAISEAFDCSVHWDNSTRTVMVESYKSPVEFTYVKESVTTETDREDVTVTVNYTYPQITSGNEFLSDREIKRLNEIAQEFTYDIFDYKDYAFNFVFDWFNVMEYFEGYPDVTIDIITTLHTSEKYDTVSFSATYNFPYFGMFSASKTVDKYTCKDFPVIGHALDIESSVVEKEVYDDIFNEFTRNFEEVRFGRDLFDEYPQDISYYISGDRITVMLSRKYLTGVGRVDGILAVTKQF